MRTATQNHEGNLSSVSVEGSVNVLVHKSSAQDYLPLQSSVVSCRIEHRPVEKQKYSNQCFCFSQKCFRQKKFCVAVEREIGIDVSLSVVVDFDLLFFVKASLCVFVIYLKQHSPVAQVT